MRQIKKTKFTLEKFEVAKLQNLKNIIGGTAATGDPDTGTETSSACSDKPNCKVIPDLPVRPSGNM